MHKFLAILAIVALVGAAPATCPTSSSGLDGAFAIVGKDVADGAFLAPSAQIAIVRSGKVTAFRSYGFAAPGLAASENTSYRIASITKMVTAVAVMQLVERGQVRLGDRLARFLPWFPHANDITIVELLAHASGIPDFVDVVSHKSFSRHVTPREVALSVARKPLLFKPGTSAAYSNTEYTLLGLVVERVTGSSLDDYEKQHIYAPAGMTQTAQDVTAGGTVLARGTPAPDDDFAFDPSWFFGSGDLVSTAADLARFDIALMDGRLIRRSTLARMSGAELQLTGYGLGLLHMRFAGTMLIGHTGGLPGFGGANMIAPKDGVAVVALGNSQAFDWESAMIPMFTALYPQSLREPANRSAVSPETTARFVTFIKNLQRGVVDRTTLSKDFNAALDTKTVTAVAKELSSYGSLHRLAFVSRHDDGRAEYDGLFDHACYPFDFTLDAQGKIATY
jgi:D-alanyl-D-alanine carboxypeptidase